MPPLLPWPGHGAAATRRRMRRAMSRAAPGAPRKARSRARPSSWARRGASPPRIRVRTRVYTVRRCRRAPECAPACVLVCKRATGLGRAGSRDLGSAGSRDLGGPGHVWTGRVTYTGRAGSRDGGGLQRAEPLQGARDGARLPHEDPHAGSPLYHDSMRARTHTRTMQTLMQGARPSHSQSDPVPSLAALPARASRSGPPCGPTLGSPPYVPSTRLLPRHHRLAAHPGSL